MKKALLLFGLLALAYIAMLSTQYHMFSLFQGITSIPLFIMLMNPVSAPLLICTFIILELFSSLPHGSMILMFLIPYLVLLIWKKFRVELSWKFFFGVLLIITLQTMALLGIVALMNVDRALQIPWNILGMQIIITTIGTFVLSFIYHEYSDRL